MNGKIQLKQKLSALFWIMRPPNSITAFFAVIAAMLIAIDNDPLSPLTYFYIGSAAFFTTAQANTHNDIIDIEVDRINSPERALPSGILTRREAGIWVVILFILACVSGILIDIKLGLTFPFSLMWAIINSLLLDAYNWKFKKNGIFGNFVVGYVVGALFFYSDIVNNFLVNQTFTMISAIGLYAMFLNWGREVIKGIRDIEGDRAGGVKTIGVLYGEKVAAIIGSLLIYIAIISSIFIIISSNNIFLPIVLIIFDIILIYKTVMIIRNPNPILATKTKKFLLKLMLIAVLSIVINQAVVKIIAQ